MLQVTVTRVAPEQRKINMCPRNGRWVTTPFQWLLGLTWSLRAGSGVKFHVHDLHFLQQENHVISININF